MHEYDFTKKNATGNSFQIRYAVRHNSSSRTAHSANKQAYLQADEALRRVSRIESCATGQDARTTIPTSILRHNPTFIQNMLQHNKNSSCRLVGKT